MPQIPVPPEDPNFLRHAIRNGNWERYEHPTKGETLTLQIGKFPVMSIHAILVEGPDRPIEAFLDELQERETVALLLSRLAQCQEQLQIAADIIVKGADEETQDHRWIIAYMGDRRYSWVCSCGSRQDDISDSAMAKSLASVHVEEALEAQP